MWMSSGKIQHTVGAHLALIVHVAKGFIHSSAFMHSTLLINHAEEGVRKDPTHITCELNVGLESLLYTMIGMDLLLKLMPISDILHQHNAQYLQFLMELEQGLLEVEGPETSLGHHMI